MSQTLVWRFTRPPIANAAARDAHDAGVWPSRRDEDSVWVMIGTGAPKSPWQQDMYERGGSSVGQRMTLAFVAGLLVAFAWWLLLGPGLPKLGQWLGWNLQPGDFVRRLALAIGFSVYYIRVLFTVFVFLKRGMSWLEVFSIIPFILGVVLLMGIAGGINHNVFGRAGIIGIVFFVFGSWTNSYSEYQRHVWKRRPENRGHLFTQGLFRFSRHPNYLGDVILFSGLCLISGAWVTALVPLGMFAGFTFANIPALDAHLRSKYGPEFDAYEKRTKRLIPFLY